MAKQDTLHNPPVQLALRTRVCLMASTIYAGMEISAESAAQKALELENAVDRVIKASKQAEVH